ncbi:MAG: hypothetical protein AAF531_06955 [Actinomycetota bacterium]
MENRIDDVRARLESIAEELTELSVEVLREAVAAGERSRPSIDKKLSQARRAVEKAARSLAPVDSDPVDDGFA